MVRENDDNESASTKVASDDEDTHSSCGGHEGTTGLSKMASKGVYSGIILSPKLLYGDESRKGSIRSLKLPLINEDWKSRQRTSSVGSRTTELKKKTSNVSNCDSSTANKTEMKKAGLPASGHLSKRRHSHMPTSNYDKDGI